MVIVDVNGQFPIRLSFAMTTKKLQDQTIDRIELLLSQPVFSHGQPYVAFSRVQQNYTIFRHKFCLPGSYYNKGEQSLKG